MSRERFALRPLSHRPVAPFSSAEAAWLWFWQCQVLRDSGARVVADAGAVARPCDPDDIYRVAAMLYRRRGLRRDELEALVAYGRRLAPPDGRLSEEARAAVLWRSGLDHLADALSAKGIVAGPPGPAQVGAQTGTRAAVR